MSQAALDDPALRNQELLSSGEPDGLAITLMPASKQGYDQPFTVPELRTLGLEFDLTALDRTSASVDVPAHAGAIAAGNALNEKKEKGFWKGVTQRVAAKIAAFGMAAKASKVAKGTVGVGGAFVAFAAGGAEVAQADYQCDETDNWSWRDYIEDDNGVLVPVYYCADTPVTTKPPVTTPQTTPTTQPNNAGGGGNGGGNGGGDTSPEVPENPNIEQNKDADAWSIVVSKNDGSFVSGWDVDDSSPGLGQEGINQYMAELAARGLDPNNPIYYNDSIGLIVQTVSPEDWSKYLDQVLSIPTTTTSTAPVDTVPDSLPDTSPDEIISAEQDTVPIPVTDAGTTPAVVASSDDESMGSGMSVPEKVGLFTLTASFLAGLGLLTRMGLRKHRVGQGGSSAITPAGAKQPDAIEDKGRTPSKPSGGGLSWPPSPPIGGAPAAGN